MREGRRSEGRDTCINNASIFNFFAANLLCVGKLSVIIRTLTGERDEERGKESEKEMGSERERGRWVDGC